MSRFLANLLLGPLIGSLVFLAAFVGVARPGLDEIPTLLVGLPCLLAFGYMAGLFPAFLGAVLMSLVMRLTGSPRLQLLAALPLGALAGWGGLTLLLDGIDELSSFDWWVSPVSTLAGACALFVTTIIAPRTAPSALRLGA